MKLSTFGLTVAVLALMTASAAANTTVYPTAYSSAKATSQGHGEAAVGHIFEVADVDEDGVLNVDEYDEAGLAEMGLAFEDCDLDADGLLTIDEYLELYRMHHPPGYDAEI